MLIHLQLPGPAVQEFIKYHTRATNTLEPKDWPQWLTELDNLIMGRIVSNEANNVFLAHAPGDKRP